MKQTNFQYPTFTNGGILSKEILDNLAGYGDEQARLTRARLIGCGIVNGLEYRFEKSDPCKLILSPGTAISADGNLICIDAETTYYLLKAKSPKNELEQYILSEEPAKKDFTSVKAIPSGYVLALRYAKIPATQENCSQLTCDLVNVRTYVRCVPILHPCTMTDKSSYFPQVISDYVEIERWNDIYSCLNSGVLHKRVRKLFNSGCTALLKKVGEITSWFNFDEGRAFACRFADADARRHQLQNAFTRLEKLCIKSGSSYENVEIPPYYLEFLEDMKDAVNEYIDAFNGLVSKYTRIPAGGKIDDCTVTLGVVSDGQSDLSHDMYRSYFEYVNRGDSFEQDCRIVWQLLRRFCTMAEHFSATSYQWKDKPLKIIPVNPSAPLSDRPIPFYYNTVGTDLKTVWRAQSIDLHMTDKCYDSFTEQKHLILDRSISGYSVQGYYNQPKDDILSKLQNLIDSYHLRLKCQEIKIDDISISSDSLLLLKSRFVRPLQSLKQTATINKRISSLLKSYLKSEVYKQTRLLTTQSSLSNGLVALVDKKTAKAKDSAERKSLATSYLSDAINGLSTLYLSRFYSYSADISQCIESIKKGSVPDLYNLKRVAKLLSAQKNELKAYFDIYFSELGIKNISDEKKDDYISTYALIFILAIATNSRTYPLATSEEEINKKLNADLSKAYLEFINYISSIYKSEFLYARDRYAEKNDTIYVAQCKGKVIYCFYD